MIDYMPRYPVYVPSKGRHASGSTVKFLLADGVPFKLVVEPSEEAAYRAAFPAADVLVMPRDNMRLLGARLWIREHSIAAGHDRHWQLDDNIKRIRRTWRGRRLPCESGPALRVCEDLTDRYANVGLSGLNYWFFVRGGSQPPFTVNTHVYSCSLVNNRMPHKWRLVYNDDTDLCLQVIAGGMCTINVNAFTTEKALTMTVKGGNTADLYQGDGRLIMARALERMWPGVVTVDRRFKRPQHVVDWAKLKSTLVLKEGVELHDLPPNEYGLALTQVADEVRDPVLRDAVASRAPRAPAGEDAAVVADFAQRLQACGVERGRVDEIARIATTTRRYLAGNESVRAEMAGAQVTLARWYASLAAGSPDWSVYEDDWYMGEALACYFVYSRKYVRAIDAPGVVGGRSIREVAGDVRRVADLGCGIGYTTADLKAAFPDAEVFGTNLDGLQMDFARSLGAERGFDVRGTFEGAGPVDLAVASEYFEHIPEPVAHLRSVLASLSPRVFLVANSFTARAIGHFDEYLVDGARLPGALASKAFSAAMKAAGYAKLKTKLWNGRPAVWVRQ